jgi:hypothetical protein
LGTAELLHSTDRVIDMGKKTVCALPGFISAALLTALQFATNPLGCVVSSPTSLSFVYRQVFR